MPTVKNKPLCIAPFQKLSHQDEFTALIFRHQAILVTTIAEIFTHPTAQDIDWLNINGRGHSIPEPWSFVASLILEMKSRPSFARTVLGWILATDWALRLTPEVTIEAEARNLIQFIASEENWRSALVERSAGEAYQSYIAGTPIRQQIVNDLDEDAQTNPRDNVSIAPLPWVGSLGAAISDDLELLEMMRRLSAFDLLLIEDDMILSNGHLSMRAPQNHQVSAIRSQVNQSIPLPTLRPSQGSIRIEGTDAIFRVNRKLGASGTEETVLRLVSPPPALEF